MTGGNISDVQPIKSLDELKEGDIVSLDRFLGINSQSPFIVGAIGEVPEHEREILIYSLHDPQCPDTEVPYERKTITESASQLHNIHKLRGEDYKDWKYVAVKRIG